MAKVCHMCGKGPQTGFSISHSHHKTKRRWLPNLQRTRIVINKTQKYVHLCTSCLRTKKASLQTTLTKVTNSDSFKSFIPKQN